MKKANKDAIRALIISLSLCVSSFLAAQTNNYPGTTLDFNYAFVNCGTHPSLCNFDQMTMEAWVWLDNANDDQKVMGNFQDWNNYYVMGVKEGHLFVEIVANGNVISTYNGSILSQEWTHLSFTFSKGNGGNNGSCYGYINGEVVYIKTDVVDEPISITPTNGFIIGAEPWGSTNSFPVFGKIDEARVWNIARTTEEIREHIYLSLSGSETGMVSYWQFNDGAGTLLTDMVGNNNGWLSDMNYLTWVNSSIPFGSGASNTQIVNATGNVSFTGTGLAMNFTSKTGTDTIVVSRIDTVSNIQPSGLDETLNRQYWVVENFGSGTFTTDLIFTVDEDLTHMDESCTRNIKLFTRGSNTDTAWALSGNAIAVNAQNNTATFGSVNNFSQFIITRDTSAFCGHITFDTTWSVRVNIYGDVTIEDGVTLTIAPGTYINFLGHYKIDVQGTLLASGTPSNRITFTVADTTGFSDNTHVGWNRIIFNNTPPSNSTSIIRYCLLEYGKANTGTEGKKGGMVYIHSVNNLLIENNIIRHNIADWGGAIACLNASPLITNNLITSNKAKIGGGVLYFDHSSPQLINNTMCYNEAQSLGGAIYIANNSNPVFTNTILFGNTAPEGSEVYLTPGPGNNPDFYYCIVEGGKGGFEGGGSGWNYHGSYQNNLDTDPLFTGSGTYPYQLQQYSPCINTGNPGMTGGTTDLAGNPRIFQSCNPRIDIGAYEYQGKPNLVVQGTIFESTLWCADTIKVTGDITVHDTATLTIKSGAFIEFQGHFKLDVKGRLLAEGALNDSIIFTAKDHVTGWNGIIFDDVHVWNDTSRLSYCSFINGNGDSHGGAIFMNNFHKFVISNSRFSNNTSTVSGGAIYADSATLQIKDCQFISNHCISNGGGLCFLNSTIDFKNNQVNVNRADGGLGRGGGIYVSGSDITLSGNTIETNYAFADGGGLYCATSEAVITHNTFSNNTANDGAGIYLFHTNGDISYNTITYNWGGGITFDNNSNPVFKYNLVSLNTSNYYGAGMNIDHSTPLVINNVVIGNHTEVTGGGISISYCSPTLLNNTVCDNTARNRGGGFCFYYGANAVIRNTIIYGNSAQLWGGNQAYIYDYGSHPDFYFCDVEGGKEAFTGAGGGANYHGIYENNIDLDPLFVGNGDNPYNTQSSSPCINKGDPGTTTNDAGEYDFEGGPRILNGRIDIGAYETRLQSDNFAGTALEFDGIDDRVELSHENNFDFDTTFTIETWLNIDSMSIGWHPVVSKGNSWKIRIFYLADLVNIEFGINNNALFVLYETDTATMLNKWNHIACVYHNISGNKYITLYLNGLQGPIETAESLAPNNDTVVICDGLKGKTDEFRCWNTARTIDEIRGNMHLTLSALTNGLTTYLQFNDGSGVIAKDVVGGNDGTLVNMTSPGCWVSSTIPAGGGVSNTQIVNTTGIINFAGTGLSMNITAKTGSDNIVVSRIDTIPNMGPPEPNKVFNDQYWIVDKYGSGTFNADLTFTVTEDLTTADTANPHHILLYDRGSNSDKGWTLADSAFSVDADDNTATFNGITGFSQFIVTRKLFPDNFPGTALDFDGIDDYVECGNDASLTEFDQLTLEAWVWLENAGNNQKIMGKFKDWNNYYMLGVGSGQLYSQIAADGNTINFQTGNIPSGVWTHLALSFSKGNGGNNGSCYGYINGELVFSKTDVADVPVSVNEADYPFRIGVAPWDINAFHTDGTIDEVRLWNVALDSSLVRINMYRTLRGNETGLVSYWQFNEGSGSVTADVISGNDGTLHNMENSDWVPSTAPLPFLTTGDGNWESNSVWASGQNAPAHPWSRARIEHNITINSTFEVIELKVDTSGILTITTGYQVTVSGE